MRIGFLVDDYSPYQILHAAPVAFALSRRYPAVEVSIITGEKAAADLARRLSAQYPGERCRYVRARVPRWVDWIDPLARLVAFTRKPALRRANIELFSTLDMLVVSEMSIAELRREPRLAHLRFVHTRHGAGDRASSFNDRLAAFDLVLAAGEKVRRRLIEAHGLPSERCPVVGYPKFELAGVLSTALPEFPEKRPTVLYNPHFANDESSWRRFGRAVLETFRKQDRYNLIFAPHTRIYQRALRHGARPLGRYRNCPHILIDTGSEASIDMTYTMAADIYLGDVSSQVYEFLREPRPCVFLDAHNVEDWRDSPSHRHWRVGEVIRSVEEIMPAIERVSTGMESYRPVQERLFAETFSETETPASDRAADAIAEAAGLSSRHGKETE